MEPWMVMSAVLIGIGLFLVGMAVGDRRPERSETTITWRDESGNVFKTIKFYGEAESTPWTKDYPSDYFTRSDEYRKGITADYQGIYLRNKKRR